VTAKIYRGSLPTCVHTFARGLRVAMGLPHLLDSTFQTITNRYQRSLDELHTARATSFSFTCSPHLYLVHVLLLPSLFVETSSANSFARIHFLTHKWRKVEAIEEAGAVEDALAGVALVVGE
jgi:hypothetical protein